MGETVNKRTDLLDFLSSVIGRHTWVEHHDGTWKVMLKVTGKMDTVVWEYPDREAAAISHGLIVSALFEFVVALAKES